MAVEERQVTRWQPQSLTIYDVGALETEWQGLGHSALELDLSAVTEIDAAGVQWLLSVERREGVLTLSGHSQVVAQALETLGLASDWGRRE